MAISVVENVLYKGGFLPILYFWPFATAIGEFPFKSHEEFLSVHPMFPLHVATFSHLTD